MSMRSRMVDILTRRRCDEDLMHKSEERGGDDLPPKTGGYCGRGRSPPFKERGMDTWSDP